MLNFLRASASMQDLEPFILIPTVLLQISFHFAADPCFHYKNLSDANRKITYVTPDGSSLRNGIALWELQEQKCPQQVCQHTDVVHTGQVGWMMLILQWKMVKFSRRSALVITLLVADTQKIFL